MTDTQISNSLEDDVTKAMNAVFGDSEGDEIPVRERGEGGDDAPRDRARDDVGRFAKKPDDKGDEGSEGDDTSPEGGDEGKDGAAPELPSSGFDPVAAPPPGWSEKSKADFAKLPAHIQGDIAKRESEVNQGLSRLAEYKPIQPWMDLARQNGRDLPSVLQDYNQLENAFSQNPVDGFSRICQKMQVDPVALAQAVLFQAQTGQVAQPTTPAIDIRQIESRAAQIAREQARAEFEAQRTQSDIEQFRSNPVNKHFDALKGDMVKLLQSEIAADLPSAYQMAMKMRGLDTAPAINGGAVRQDAVIKARQAAQSIRGAPSANRTEQPKTFNSIEEAANAAIEAKWGRS